MLKQTLITIVALLPALASQAYTVQECSDFGVGLTEIVAPPAKNSRTFANNAIVAYNLDTLEPAAASSGVAITLPDVNSELGGESKCFAVIHLAGADVMKATTSYDANRGLLLSIPTTTYDEEFNRIPGPALKLRINQRTSKVTVEN